jgi:hypothetical protein
MLRACYNEVTMQIAGGGASRIAKHLASCLGDCKSRLHMVLQYGTKLRESFLSVGEPGMASGCSVDQPATLSLCC